VYFCILYFCTVCNDYIIIISTTETHAKIISYSLTFKSTVEDCNSSRGLKLLEKLEGLSGLNA